MIVGRTIVCWLPRNAPALGDVAKGVIREGLGPCRAATDTLDAVEGIVTIGAGLVVLAIKRIGDGQLAVVVDVAVFTNAEGGNPPRVSASAAFRA